MIVIKFVGLAARNMKWFLTGVIPADNIMQVIADRMRNQYLKAVDTNAEAMEHLIPFSSGKKRVPWLLDTMFIKLLELLRPVEHPYRL